ncbi:MAG: flagellar basal body-associated FliL family protein, partial [Chloroflexota bacterium]
ASAKADALKTLEDAFAVDHAPQITAFNDVITNDLSTKTASELQSPGGKEALRKQLIADFNGRLAEPPHVIWIYFTDFVMQ